MEIVAIVLLVGFAVLTIFSYMRPPHGDAHMAPPVQGGMSEEEATRMIESITSSPYFRSLKPLNEHVKGKTVRQSEAGNAGFILMLSDESWVAAFRSGNEVGFRIGKGNPDSESLRAVRSSDYGDASEPLEEDRQYSSQRCDNVAEVHKSHGHQLEGLSCGKRSFNFAFVGGRELDFQRVNDRNGKPSVRVFWEQW